MRAARRGKGQADSVALSPKPPYAVNGMYGGERKGGEKKKGSTREGDCLSKIKLRSGLVAHRVGVFAGEVTATTAGMLRAGKMVRCAIT